MEGFEEFFAAHYGPVLHAVGLATGDPQRAEDMTQEAFARAYRRWSGVSAMERPVAWVYVVALNAARRSFRDERLAARADPGTVDREVEGDVTDAVTLRALLAELPPRQRAAVVLRYLADLSVAETADAMGCAEGTVKSAVHAALRHLRADLDEEAVHGP
ncbi:MAG TPA: SigE family RNA polymerase sigma factor [Mycobacteriales bacterium]|nr:SigE family RNA polymerase sigma factor [Mycobacteriales bacterium]